MRVIRGKLKKQLLVLFIIFIVLGVFLAYFRNSPKVMGTCVGVVGVVSIICYIQYVIIISSRFKPAEKKVSYIKKVTILYWGGWVICGIAVWVNSLGDYNIGHVLVVIGGFIQLWATVMVFISLIWVRK